MSVMNPCEAITAEISRPTARLRWHQPTDGCEPVLQQEWEVIEYTMHKPTGRRTEWLAVPTEQ